MDGYLYNCLKNKDEIKILCNINVEKKDSCKEKKEFLRLKGKKRNHC